MSCPCIYRQADLTALLRAGGDICGYFHLSVVNLQDGAEPTRLRVLGDDRGGAQRSSPSFP